MRLSSGACGLGMVSASYLVQRRPLSRAELARWVD
jgi:hypothetical protein